MSFDDYTADQWREKHEAARRQWHEERTNLQEELKATQRELEYVAARSRQRDEENAVLRAERDRAARAAVMQCPDTGTGASAMGWCAIAAKLRIDDAELAEANRKQRLHLYGTPDEVLNGNGIPISMLAIHPDTRRLDRLQSLGNFAVWCGSYASSHPDRELRGVPIVEISKMDDDGYGPGDLIAKGRTLAAAIDSITDREGR